MMVPVLTGLASGRLETGFTIGLGAMLLSETPSATTSSSGETTKDGPSPLSALLPAGVAVIIATLICGGVWTDPALVLLAGAAAAISGYSRPVGVAAIRFIIYLVLSVTVLQSAGDHRSAAALIFGLGALWNMVIRRLLVRPGEEGAAQAAAAPPARQPTPAQRRAYWRRTLRTLSGWQFPIRIVAGLGAASVLRQLWPSHHFGWIVLTVALLTQRPIEHLPVKTIQRALGTALGVSLTWAIVTWVSSPVLLAVLICLLAIAAAVARTRNYLVYAAISTPVILLVLDFGKPLQTSLLTDRLVATALGAAIVIGANLVLDWGLKRTA